jgi:hypothetical protein
VTAEPTTRAGLVPSGEDVALVDLLDGLIGGGVVVTGDVVLAVADIDLVYLGLRLVLAPAHELRGPTAGSLRTGGG